MKTSYIYCEIKEEKLIFAHIELNPTLTIHSQNTYPLSFLTFSDSKLFNPISLTTSFFSFKETLSENAKHYPLLLSYPSLEFICKEEVLSSFQLLLLFSTYVRPPKLLLSYSLLDSQLTWKELHNQRITTFEPPPLTSLIGTWAVRSTLLLCIITLMSLASLGQQRRYNLLKHHHEEQEQSYAQALQKGAQPHGTSLPLTSLSPLQQWEAKTTTWHKDPSFLCSLLSETPPFQGWLTRFDLTPSPKPTLLLEGHCLEESQIPSFLAFLEKKTGISYSLEALTYDQPASSFNFKIKGPILSSS